MARRNKNIKVISLFSGCGGMDIGFMKAGFSIVYANDFDKDAVMTYEKNIGEIDNRDIKQVKIDEVPSADVLLAGFPCQPFSNAGNRKGVNDVRGTLFYDALNFVRAKQPKVVVFENVRGLLSIVNNEGKKFIDEIVSRLDKVGKGYKVFYELVNANDYGVPQNRMRLVLVGVRKDLKKTYRLPEKIDNSKTSLKFVLKNLPKNDLNDEHWELSPQSKKLIVHIPAGGSWKSIPDKHLPERLKKIKANMRKYHAPNFYRRFSLDEVCGTITAAATPENSGIIHPHKNRRYTVREIARIQSFPDNFKFVARSIAGKYKVIGNAVPPQLAFTIAKSIKSQIFS